MSASLAALACNGASEPQHSVVERYVEKLSEGDFDGAMALRCADERVDARLAEQFLNEVRRMEQSAGVPLEVVAMETVSDRQVVLPSGAEPHRQLKFSLRTTTGRSQPVRVFTAIEDGEERLCGHAPEESFEVRDQLGRTDVVARPERIEDLQAVVEAVEKHFTGSVNNAERSGQPNGVAEPIVEAWGTFWTTGQFGGVTVSLRRFADSESAMRVAVQLIATRSADGIELFDVPAMPDAVGLRHNASAWTMVQPADVGDHIDVVVATFDDVVVSIAVSPVAADDDHSAIAAVAERIVP